jgi:hypothetical protein
MITKDKVTEIFCITDDFCSFFDALIKFVNRSSNTNVDLILKEVITVISPNKFTINHNYNKQHSCLRRYPIEIYSARLTSLRSLQNDTHLKADSIKKKYIL